LYFVNNSSSLEICTVIISSSINLQINNWIPIILESYYSYYSLNTFEIVKHSGGVLRILNPKEQINEIQNVQLFLTDADYLIPGNNIEIVTYFGIKFNSIIYTPAERFLKSNLGFSIDEDILFFANTPEEKQLNI